MPELPEVETVCRGLKQNCQNKIVHSVQFFTQKMRNVLPQSLIKRVCLGHNIISFHRRAKYIIMKTSKGQLLFHLGMTGQLLLLKDKDPKFKHTHVIFSLGFSPDFHYLHFVDPRRFGSIDACLGDEESSFTCLQHLGPEPLEEMHLGPHLFSLGSKSSRPVKSLIMDATIVVGVGNIYASEALFAAGIHPLRPAKSLSLIDYKNIANAIKKTLTKAIKAGGTTLKDFKQMTGEPGYFSLKLKVYDRENKPCLKCQKTIKRIVISGRSTYYCDDCQNYKKKSFLV